MSAACPPISPPVYPLMTYAFQLQQLPTYAAHQNRLTPPITPFHQQFAYQHSIASSSSSSSSQMQPFSHESDSRDSDSDDEEIDVVASPVDRPTMTMTPPTSPTVSLLNVSDDFRRMYAESAAQPDGSQPTMSLVMRTSRNVHQQKHMMANCGMALHTGIVQRNDTKLWRPY